jgi:competence protein ComEC
MGKGSHQNRIISQIHVRWVVLVVLFASTFFIWVVVLRADRHGVLTVAFLDVGQGDAIYIEAPNGNQMLIDGGVSSGAILRPLGRVMPFYDRSLDLVLATHPDQDHVGGLPAVLERMRVNGVVTTENSAATGAYTAFEDVIRANNIPRILARAGRRIVLDEGVTLEILFPDRSTQGWETNTGSIVARLSYGDTSFLFTGDSPIAIEKYLTGKYGSTLKTDVVKLGHHGSRTSSSREFLSAAQPTYAVVSAGKGNRYGHPHEEVLDLTDEMRISILNTANYGSIVFKTDGALLWQE